MLDEADVLFGLPPERFVPERDALAKRLRADKRRADADAVKALRRPTLAAWAANQVLRTQRTDARRLFSAADALAAGPEDPGAWRRAAEELRDAVEALVTAAAGLLTERGELSQATLDKVRETLRTAVVDPAHRESAEHGRLERELTGGGFGGLAAGLGEPAAAAGPSAEEPRAGGRSKRRAAPARPSAKPPERGERARRQQEDREARERAAARARARKGERAAREALEAAQARRRESERGLARARAAVDAAETALDEARSQEERLAAEHEAARRALADAGS